MKKALIALAAILAFVFLTAESCSDQSAANDKIRASQSANPDKEILEEAYIPRTSSFYAPLTDGRKVLCVFATSGNNWPGGLSCDWSNAR